MRSAGDLLTMAWLQSRTEMQRQGLAPAIETELCQPFPIETNLAPVVVAVVVDLFVFDLFPFC